MPGALFLDTIIDLKNQNRWVERFGIGDCKIHLRDQRKNAKQTYI